MGGLNNPVGSSACLEWLLLASLLVARAALRLPNLAQRLVFYFQKRRNPVFVYTTTDG